MHAGCDADSGRPRRERSVSPALNWAVVTLVALFGLASSRMALAMTSAWSRSMGPAVNFWATENVPSRA